MIVDPSGCDSVALYKSATNVGGVLRKMVRKLCIIYKKVLDKKTALNAITYGFLYKPGQKQYEGRTVFYGIHHFIVVSGGEHGYNYRRRSRDYLIT